jgi:hypothetical protein
MGSFESKTLTPQEQMRAYKREIDHAVRDLDKARRQLEQQKVKLEADLRVAVRQNNTVSSAPQLQHTPHHIL